MTPDIDQQAFAKQRVGPRRVAQRAFLGALLFACVPAAPIWAQAPQHFWSQGFGGASTALGRVLAVDGTGNVIAAGYFNDTVDFGGGPLVSNGQDDAFVAKYDTDGNHQWSLSFGDVLDDSPRGIATDAAGNVFITGYFEGTVDLGGGPLVSAGDRDIFVAKYDAAGNHAWSQSFGNFASDSGTDITTDSQGNVLFTGFFRDTVNVGGTDLASAGSSDILVAKFDTDGAHIWSERFGGGGAEAGTDIATDTTNVILAGSFNGPVSVGDSTFTPLGEIDIFFAKYDADGNHLWSQAFGDIESDNALDLTTDAAGDIFLSGWFGGTVSVGGTPLVSNGALDGFFAKYDPDGNHLWSRGFGAANADYAQWIETDASGNVFVTGSFFMSADFGGGTINAAGDNDAFVAMYDTDGNHTWSHAYGDADTDLGAAVAVDPAGDVLILGNFLGSIGFGGLVLTDAGNGEMYLAKLGTTIVGVEQLPVPGAATRLAMGQSRPNPTRARSTIDVMIPSSGHVRLRVFDARGRLVTTLVDRHVERGRYSIAWDGRGAYESPLPSGVYVYRLESGGESVSQKVTLVR